jgi:hypothetical protein
MTLSDGGMISEYLVVGGIRIGRGNWNALRNLPQLQFVYHKLHMTWLAMKPGPPHLEAKD